MKKYLLSILVVLVLVAPALAQGPIFLPLIIKGAPMPTCDDNWKLIRPEATTNYVLNPSGETTGNFAAGGGSVTRSTTYSKYGLYSYYVQSAANHDGAQLTLSALTNAEHYASLLVRGTLPPGGWLWGLDGANWRVPQLLEDIDDDWTLYGAWFPAIQANGSTTLYVYQSGGGSGAFYLDGVQVEAKSYWTTYCDGSRDGCAWNGIANAGTSTRSAQSRAGGRVLDLWDEYGFLVESFSGTGMAPQKMSVDEYATLPGGRLNNAKIAARSFTLTGTFLAESEADLYAKRQSLLEELSTDRYLYNQPVRLRFEGAEVHKEIAAHFEAGLEAQLDAYAGAYKRDLMTDQVETTTRWRERVALRFVSDNPFWYEIGESSTALDTNDSATFRVIGGRLRSSGQWDAMGPPDVAGTYNYVQTIAEDDTYVYIGGAFTDFDNIDNADYIVRWNKVTETYSALGTGMDDDVYALIIGADGTLYAGGAFDNAGGGAAAKIASWNGVAWSALGAGMNNSVYGLRFGLYGILYAGGAFTTAGGGAANRIASWDGAAWSALGTGMNGAVIDVVIGIDGTLYAGGNFTTADGGAAVNIASWDGAAWSAMGSGLNAQVNTLVIGDDDTLYAGGAFTIAGGSGANYIAVWNGTAWTPLGGGANSTVYDIAVGPEGVLYVAGAFTTAGGLDADGLALWNGSSWTHWDINWPGAGGGYAILPSRYVDPVIQSYDLYMGSTQTGTGYYAGAATVTNDGTQPAYPVIVFTRSGGTTATLTSVRNETTGQELLFDYDLANGETLTIDLTPANKSIMSSFYGSRLDAILPNSDFGTFVLQPGDNNITSFVDVVGAPTITGWMEWRDAYKSQD